jgi:hypothetical protein
LKPGSNAHFRPITVQISLAMRISIKRVAALPVSYTESPIAVYQCDTLAADYIADKPGLLVPIQKEKEKKMKKI